MWLSERIRKVKVITNFLKEIRFPLLELEDVN